MFRTKTIALLYGLLVFMACKEKYVARTTYPYTGYLVVEGHIEAGGGPTYIRLSRTTSLDSAYFRPETTGAVSVESDNNQSYILSADGAGGYSAQVPVDPARQYRLRIISQNREYLSDFVATRITPPVDSLHWEEHNDGVQISVNSHDAANQTIYYKWEFTETWKYNARYHANLIWQNDNVEFRSDEQQIYTCWKSDTPSTILVASTQKLSEDRVSGQPITFISYSTPFNKLYTRYSVMVTEAALTKAEYEWYDRLKKNTETLGSIFDAQPSDITGNIHSLADSTEPVIGFAGCRTETSSRIFIGRAQLQVKYLSNGYESCRQDSIFSVIPDDLRPVFGPSGYDIPIDFVYIMGNLVGVSGSSYDCTDCRLKGGVLMRPSFWIE